MDVYGGGEGGDGCVCVSVFMVSFFYEGLSFPIVDTLRFVLIYTCHVVNLVCELT